MATQTAITEPGSGTPMLFNNGLSQPGETPIANATPGRYPVDYVLAFDIEKTGERTDKNSMVAIGGCVIGVETLEVVSRFLCFMKVEPGHGFSPLCKKEYWDNWVKFPMNEIVLKSIDKQGVDPRAGIHAFATWLDNHESSFEKQNKHLAVVVDTVGSDAMWISHYFQKYLNRPPIEDQYGNDSLYRSIKHSGAYAKGLAGYDGSPDFNWRHVLQEKGVELPDQSMHNHMPDSDAQSIATTYAACVRWAHNQRQPAKVASGN